MNDDMINLSRQRAEEYFNSGLHCAESIVMAIARSHSIESMIVPKAATAFGSGLARTCDICGALTGAIMSISMLWGRSESTESFEKTYSATQRIIQEFEQEFGSRNCKTLLGCDLSTMEGEIKFIDQKLYLQCAMYTARASEIAARILNEHSYCQLIGIVPNTTSSP